MKNATPRPWRQGHIAGHRFVIGDGGATTVAEMWNPAQSEANAELIVTAVNNHDDLVAALEWLVHLGCGIGKAGRDPETGEWEDAIKAGKTALAKAREA